MYASDVLTCVHVMQMHGGGAKKGGSGTDKIVNREPSKRGGTRGGKASGAPYMLPEFVLHSHYMLPVCHCMSHTCKCNVQGQCTSVAAW